MGFFRGAGLLLVSSAGGVGQPRVFLGQRRGFRQLERRLAQYGLPCGPGYWTIPGGGAHRDEDLRVCAFREALEECFPRSYHLSQQADGGAAGPEAAFERGIQSLLGTSEALEVEEPPHRLRLPGYHYATYLIRLPGTPDLTAWADHHDEFHQGTWWPLEKLPSRLHLCTRWALDHFRRRGLL